MSVRIVPQSTTAKPYPWEDPGWVDSLGNHLERIDAALGALGVDKGAVTKDLTESLGRLVTRFPQDFAPYGEHRPPRPEARASLLAVIRNFLAGLKVVEEEATTVVRELPLCVFDAPDVPNARTVYAESQSAGGTAGWSIEVLGSSYGADVTLSVTQSSEFTASAGERKLIFAPVHLRVVRAALYKRGALQERFLKAELFEPEVREANGIRSLTDADWRVLVGRGRVLERFDLSGDTGDNPAKSGRKIDLAGTFETTLGFSAFNLKTKVTAKCTAEQTAEATFELPPGRRYELRAPQSVTGFVFGA